MAGRLVGKPRTVLEQLLDEMDHTQEEVTKQFDAKAAELGLRGVTMTERHLRRLASGERRGTTPATRRVLRAMFGRPIDELLAPWPGPAAGGVSPAGLVVASSLDSSQEDLGAASQRARQFAEYIKTSLTGEMMDQVEDDVRELAALYSRRPVQEILSRLIATQEMVFRLLETSQRPAHARQLYFLAGVVGGMLARASHDLSHPYNALTQAHTAFACADRAEHDGLRAWIRGLQSMITYWAGRPEESVKHAKSGRVFALAAHNTAAIWLPAVEARAWARLGNAGMVRELITEADRQREAVRSDSLDELGGICTFGVSRQLYCAADALAWLPEETELCERYAEQAVDAYGDTSAPDWSFSFAAGSRADLAIARIGQLETEGAAEVLAPVLELPVHQRTNPIVQSLKRVGTALNAAPPDEHGRSLREEIEAVTNFPNRNVLTGKVI